MPTRHVRGYRAALIVSVLGIFTLAAPTFLAAQSISEFQVPSPGANLHSVGTDLRFITVGPDNALWFSETGDLKVGRITLQGAITEYPTPDSPYGVATGPDGNLWIATYGGVDRMTPTGAVTFFPAPAAIDPSEFAAYKILRGPDDAMWFSVTQGYVGRITMSGSMTVFNIPSALNTGGGLYGLAFGSDGNLWYGVFGQNGATPLLGRMTTAGVITEFSGWGPFDLTMGPDGILWGSDNSNLGRVSMPGGMVQTFPIPNYFSITTGPDGDLWVATSPTSLGRVTTVGGLTNIPVTTVVNTQFGSGSMPYAFVAGPDGNLWFTEQWGNKIGRVNLASAANLCTPNTQTLCLNGGRFAVTATFQQTSGGPSAPATAVSLTDDTGYFWFFDPTNIEMVTKLLNGCSINGNYWFFGAGLTNVGVSVFVQDLQSGTMKPYMNTFGTSFAPVQDTSAFHTCP
jgi:virginiamycin B lyase